MKKMLATVLLSCTVFFSFANPPVKEKVLKIFQNVFPDVENAKWYEFEDYYQVYFDKDDVKCRIKFNFDGNIISSTRYYEEKSVCPFLKLKLAQKYPGKKIFGVTEVNSENELTYEFVLEDAKHWFNVTSNSIGDMHVTKKMQKPVDTSSSSH